LELLKNRKIAIIITIIVVISATMFGVGKSLNGLVKEAEKVFYEGAEPEGAGFIQPSINHYLGIVSQAALDTSSLFAGHPELSDEAAALTAARRSLSDAMGAKNIPEMYAAYRSILTASDVFINSAGNAELSEREQSALNDYRTTLRGAAIAIRNNEYNIKAGNFMDGAFFLTGLLKPFVFVTSPQVFDQEIPDILLNSP